MTAAQLSNQLHIDRKAMMNYVHNRFGITLTPEVVIDEGLKAKIKRHHALKFISKYYIKKGFQVAYRGGVKTYVKKNKSKSTSKVPYIKFIPTAFETNRRKH